MTPADWYIVWGAVALIYLGIGVILSNVLGKDEKNDKMKAIDRIGCILFWLPLGLAAVIFR